jgi:hypothetical protein
MRQISKGIHDVRNHSWTGKIQGAFPELHQRHLYKIVFGNAKNLY